MKIDDVYRNKYIYIISKYIYTHKTTTALTSVIDHDVAFDICKFVLLLQILYFMCFQLERGWCSLIRCDDSNSSFLKDLSPQ